MKSLYFIAVIPPEEICNEITDFKKDIANRFNSIKSLRVIPHVTLFPPVSLEGMQEKNFVEKFKNLEIDSESFEIEVNDFGCFPNKKNPVIFVKPEENLNLKNLQQKVFQQLKLEGLHYSFHPHFTIAYRDLSFENFTKAWEEYQSRKYSAKFKTEKITLLKHNGNHWEIFHEKTLK